LLSPDALHDALKRVEVLRENPFQNDYGKGFADGVEWVLGLFAECDDLEWEELT